MILVDSTIWIDLLRGTDSIFQRKLHQLIEEEEEVCLTAINLTEILQGIRSDTEFERTRRCLLLFPIYSIKNIDTYIHASRIYRACLGGGKTVRKTVDSIIAAIAIENQLSLFHNDRDFDKIASCTRLKIFQF